MSVPGQMTAKTLNALKGWGVDMYALDFAAPLSANVTISPVYPGTVAHLNASGQLELGVSGFQMPLHIFPRSDDPDVVIAGGDPVNDAGVAVSGIPAYGGGPILCLVGCGPYELASTQYDVNGGSYLPNTPLKAQVSNTVAATGGVLTTGIAGTDTIVGCVSRGVQNNGYGYNALCFWTVFLPVV
jgi:hypothetical protein